MSNSNLSDAQFGDYRGQHSAPDPDFGQPMHSFNDMMPDYHSHPEWYRTGDDIADRESHAAVQSAKDNPDREVTVYRAVPKDVNQINPGDWVSPSRAYAKQHNRSVLDGKGRVIKLKGRASEFYTNGDSINEWGYHPRQGK